MQAGGERPVRPRPDDPADAIDRRQRGQAEFGDHPLRARAIRRLPTADGTPREDQGGAQEGGEDAAPEPHLAVGVGRDVAPSRRSEEQ